jgi:hypothetical protein
MRFHQRLMASCLAFAAGWLVSVHAQTLDESLLEQHASATQGREPISNEPGVWNVWIEIDLGTLEQFDSNTDPHLLGAMQLGHPGWSNATAIATLGGMNNSVFIDASMNWQSQYVPRPVFVGASANVWKNLSVGVQGGRAWTPVFVNCRGADGEMVVASWNQVRFADLVDQYLYYDEIHEGNHWEFEYNGQFAEGLKGWRLELVAQQELTMGLGWTASLGKTVGMKDQIASAASEMFGGQGLIASNQLGATLTPINAAATPTSISLGMTYRSRGWLMGLSWSNVFISGTQRNDWVSQGADPVEPLTQVRAKLGVNF